MSDRRQAVATALAEAIPYALKGNDMQVISHLQAALSALGLDDLGADESAFGAMRRAEARRDR